MSADVFVLIEQLRDEVSEISYVMLAAAKESAKAAGGKVVGVLMGHDSQELAADLAADEILYVDDPKLAEFSPDTYATTLAHLIAEKKPRAVLLGHTSIGADLAGVLASQLELPLVSSCLKLTADGKFVSQICGGKILAEGDVPTPISLITMTPGGHAAEDGKASASPPILSVPAPSLESAGIQLSGYMEPEAADVDISKETVLIAVGRGVQNQDNISMAEDLAKALGATVCGSRPVVDQGWLPTSRLVGKSGKYVKPKVYLALGISGAPEHVEAIGNSECIIAINTDATAPIFDVATYGAQADMFDLLEPLIEEIGRVKA